MVEELLEDANPNVEWWENVAKEMMLKGIYRILYVEIENIMVGFIDYMIYPEPSTGTFHGVAQHFYVYPEFRHTIVPKLLYRKVFDIAKQMGINTLELFCAPEDEEKWKRKGFDKKRIMVRRYRNV